MQFDDFIKSTANSLPPAALDTCLISLWFDAKGDWQKAHTLIDSIAEKNAYWVHAYLHRKEGDLWNADYWYTKAGKKRPAVSLDEEWEMIAKHLLKMA